MAASSALPPMNQRRLRSFLLPSIEKCDLSLYAHSAALERCSQKTAVTSPQPKQKGPLVSSVDNALDTTSVAKDQKRQERPSNSKKTRRRHLESKGTKDEVSFDSADTKTTYDSTLNFPNVKGHKNSKVVVRITENLTQPLRHNLIPPRAALPNSLRDRKSKGEKYKQSKSSTLQSKTLARVLTDRMQQQPESLTSLKEDNFGSVDKRERAFSSFLRSNGRQKTKVSKMTDTSQTLSTIKREDKRQMNSRPSLQEIKKRKHQSNSHLHLPTKKEPRPPFASKYAPSSSESKLLQHASQPEKDPVARKIASSPEGTPLPTIRLSAKVPVQATRGLRFESIDLNNDVSHGLKPTSKIHVQRVRNSVTNLSQKSLSSKAGESKKVTSSPHEAPSDSEVNQKSIFGEKPNGVTSCHTTLESVKPSVNYFPSTQKTRLSQLESYQNVLDFKNSKFRNTFSRQQYEEFTSVFGTHPKILSKSTMTSQHSSTANCHSNDNTSYCQSKTLNKSQMNLPDTMLQIAKGHLCMFKSLNPQPEGYHENSSESNFLSGHLVCKSSPYCTEKNVLLTLDPSHCQVPPQQCDDLINHQQSNKSRPKFNHDQTIEAECCERQLASSSEKISNTTSDRIIDGDLSIEKLRVTAVHPPPCKEPTSKAEKYVSTRVAAVPPSNHYLSSGPMCRPFQQNSNPPRSHFLSNLFTSKKLKGLNKTSPATNISIQTLYVPKEADQHQFFSGTSGRHNNEFSKTSKLFEVIKSFMSGGRLNEKKSFESDNNDVQQSNECDAIYNHHLKMAAAKTSSPLPLMDPQYVEALHKNQMKDKNWTIPSNIQPFKKSFCGPNPKEFRSFTKLLPQSSLDSSTIDQGSWAAKRSPAHTLIIWDWDDTILPTYYLAIEHKLNLIDNYIPEVLKRPLAELELKVIRSLEMSMRHGCTILVTNASFRWLTDSAQKFMPQVWQFICDHKMKILSARDVCQESGLPQLQWKRYLIRDQIEIFFRHLHIPETNLVQTIDKLKNIEIDDQTINDLTESFECVSARKDVQDGHAVESTDQIVVEAQDLKTLIEKVFKYYTDQSIDVSKRLDRFVRQLSQLLNLDKAILSMTGLMLREEEELDSNALCPFDERSFSDYNPCLQKQESPKLQTPGHILSQKLEHDSLQSSANKEYRIQQQQQQQLSNQYNTELKFCEISPERLVTDSLTHRIHQRVNSESTETHDMRNSVDQSYSTTQSQMHHLDLIVPGIEMKKQSIEWLLGEETLKRTNGLLQSAQQLISGGIISMPSLFPSPPPELGLLSVPCCVVSIGDGAGERDAVLSVMYQSDKNHRNLITKVCEMREIICQQLFKKFIHHLNKKIQTSSYNGFNDTHSVKTPISTSLLTQASNIVTDTIPDVVVKDKQKTKDEVDTMKIKIPNASWSFKSVKLSAHSNIDQLCITHDACSQILSALLRIEECLDAGAAEVEKLQEDQAIKLQNPFEDEEDYIMEHLFPPQTMTNQCKIDHEKIMSSISDLQNKNSISLSSHYNKIHKSVDSIPQYFSTCMTDMVTFGIYPNHYANQCPKSYSDQSPKLYSDQSPKLYSDQCPKLYSDQCPKVYSDQCPKVYSDQYPKMYSDQCPKVYSDHYPILYSDQCPQLYSDQYPKVYSDQCPTNYYKGLHTNTHPINNQLISSQNALVDSQCKSMQQCITPSLY